jgi:hypothetical protein
LTVKDKLGRTSSATGQVDATSPPVHVIQPNPNIGVFAGYMDDHHGSNPQPQPSPFFGSSSVVFAGLSDNGLPTGSGWDSSAVRVHNNTGSPISGVSVTVDVGGSVFNLAPWNNNTIPAGGDLVVAQTANGNFDGSDTNSVGCFGCDPALCISPGPDSTIPVVHVQIGGQVWDYQDTGQVINTKGWDSAGCPDPGNGNRSDESQPWALL